MFILFRVTESTGVRQGTTWDKAHSHTIHTHIYGQFRELQVTSAWFWTAEGNQNTQQKPHEDMGRTYKLYSPHTWDPGRDSDTALRGVRHQC